MARKPVDELAPVPEAPRPSSATEADGIQNARSEARKYLLDAVRLYAAVAFSHDSEVSLFTRVGAAKELVGLAAVSQPPPTPPTPAYERRDGDGRAVD